MKVQVDDIFAALILSLAMLRRLDVRTTQASQNPSVPEAEFQRWRSLALRAYDLVAVACGAKVVLSLAWYMGGLALGVGTPWFQLVGFLVFLSWALALIWAWKLGTDARVMRLQLGIRLRREQSAAP